MFRFRYPVIVSGAVWVCMYGATAGNIYVYDLIDGSCVHGDYLTQYGPNCEIV